MMKMETWNALPDDLKAILEVAGRSHAVHMWTMTSYDDLTSVGKLKEAGAEMVEWDPALTKKIKGLIRDVHIETGRETEAGSKMIDSILAFLEQAEG